MELFDEEDFKPKKSNKKTTTIILVIISIVLILVIALAILIVYLKSSTLTVTLNDQTSQNIKNMLIIDETSNKVYVPIKRIATYLGYEAYSGSYETKSEETNQCYVQSDDEIAMFTLNENIIYKVLTSGDSDYDYYYINEPVVSKNGELCTTMDGIEKAFNVSFNYDVENNKITIYTMNYLISYYSSVVGNYGYTQISEDFTNQKTVLEDMLIVEKGDDNNKKVGVIKASTGDTILEAKYSAITYLDHTQDFLVTDNSKQGIISNSRKTKLKIEYDKIELMDYDAELYLVEQDEKQGVVNFDGTIVIALDYDEIGIDSSSFKENEIKNDYILADTLIPVQQNELWGFFDTKGNQITECKYDEVGCVMANNKAGYNLLVIPDYNVIIVGKDDKYTLLTITGKEIWDFFPFDNAYIVISEGEKSYKATYNTQIADLVAQLDKMGYGKETTSKQTNSNQTNENTTTDQQSTTNDEGNGENNADNNNEENSQETEENGNNEEQENSDNNENGEEQENNDNNGE